MLFQNQDCFGIAVCMKTVSPVRPDRYFGASGRGGVDVERVEMTFKQKFKWKIKQFSLHTLRACVIILVV